MFGSGAGSSAGRGGGMDGGALERVMIPMAEGTISSVAGDYDCDEFPRRDERLPQWSQQETKDFIRIRAELERDLTVSKRNKTLWETVAARMKGLGYRRTAEQCKCKWKNLINRYKGKETSSEQDGGRQFPFFKELHAIFLEREMNMQQMLFDSETGPTHPKKRIKCIRSDQSPKHLSDFEDEEEESQELRVTSTTSPQKRKGEKEKLQKSGRKALGQFSLGNMNNSGCSLNGVQAILKEFLKQQQRIETTWRESIEKHACERQMFEQEWRHSMEKLERERLMAEEAWREREDRRRMREEIRAEKRDALVTMLLNKLISEPHHP